MLAHAQQVFHEASTAMQPVYALVAIIGTSGLVTLLIGSATQWGDPNPY